MCHAALIVLYCVFISLVVQSLDVLLFDAIGDVAKFCFYFFLAILSFGVCGYLIFFEPIKKILHHHFRASAVMMASTLGWLFVFLIIFLLGLLRSMTFGGV